MTLSKLSVDDLERIQAWRVIMETIDDEDTSLEPALVDEMGLIDERNEDVWCLCKAIFSNGDEHKAMAMCRGDFNEGPLLFTVFKGVEYFPVMVPPAPDFVLKEQGPEKFCEAFERTSSEVFPLTIEVIPKFKVQPLERSVVINHWGIEGSKM